MHIKGQNVLCPGSLGLHSIKAPRDFHWTLLKGMVSSVWFCSIPGGLLFPPVFAFSRVPLTTAFQQIKSWMDKQHRCGCRCFSRSHHTPLILMDVSSGDISTEPEYLEKTIRSYWVYNKNFVFSVFLSNNPAVHFYLSYWKFYFLII